MCLLLLAYQVNPDYPLVIAANRDEFHRRPAAPADWWPEGDILAGRDLEAGGSWFGVNRRGRFAAVTNYREPEPRAIGSRSRGELVVETLRSDSPGLAWLQHLQAEAQQFSGFNLLFGDRQGVFSFSNRSLQPAQLEPGIYGLSNHLLETPWPKVVRGKAALEAYLHSPQLGSVEPLLVLLADRMPASDDELPQTGVSREWERLLSAMFIVSPEYGTRASTVVLVDRDGQVEFAERSFDSAGLPIAERHFRFKAEEEK
ncbi:MAG: NRDE family protein [Xanthomonadaceae bacterium]|nr:NRDE family protein [Xanthomonadaceae bacterium]